MGMEHTQGLKLIIKAIENDNRDKMFNKWLHDDARYEVSFEEYCNMNTPYRKSTEEEKNEILNRYGSGINGSI